MCELKLRIKDRIALHRIADYECGVGADCSKCGYSFHIALSGVDTYGCIVSIAQKTLTHEASIHKRK